MLDSELNKKKRSHIRFEPDKNTIAWLSMKSVDAKNFKGDIVGLPVNESTGGCSVIFNTEKELKIGEVYLIQVGKLSAMKAQLRWKNEFRKNVFETGWMYL